MSTTTTWQPQRVGGVAGQLISFPQNDPLVLWQSSSSYQRPALARRLEGERID